MQGNITKVYHAIENILSYFIGMGVGYILLKDDNANDSIYSIIVGLVFVIYVVPIILEHKENK